MAKSVWPLLHPPTNSSTPLQIHMFSSSLTSSWPLSSWQGKVIWSGCSCSVFKVIELDNFRWRHAYYSKLMSSFYRDMLLSDFLKSRELKLLRALANGGDPGIEGSWLYSSISSGTLSMSLILLKATWPSQNAFSLFMHTTSL